jgi:hypothetical protein
VIREERDRCVDRADSVFQPDGFRSSDLLLEFAKSDPRAEVACHIEEGHVTVACVVDGLRDVVAPGVYARGTER